MSGYRSIEIFQDQNLGWRWRVRGANRSDVVADSGESYVHRKDALAMAVELFPGLPIVRVAMKTLPEPEPPEPVPGPEYEEPDSGD